MNLHPQAQAVVDAIGRMKLTPLDALTPAEARAQFRKSRGPFFAPSVEVASVVDHALPGPGGDLPVRVYRPIGSRPSELLPALVYFHGGGWVLGDLDTHDSLCRLLCNAAGCAVAAVDYRLAPENKFPAAVEDALAATLYLATKGADLGIDGARLAAAGDSAGGNLTAVVALALRDQGGPQLKLQVLIYPVTDMAMDTPTYTSLGEGYLLTRERMLYFKRCYLRGPEDSANWQASPLKANDLSRLPPALVITASHDPLVDEGKAYADRLAAAGTTVRYKCYEGMIHGFVQLGGAMDAGLTAITEIASASKRALFSESEG